MNDPAESYGTIRVAHDHDEVDVTGRDREGAIATYQEDTARLLRAKLADARKLLEHIERRKGEGK